VVERTCSLGLGRWLSQGRILMPTSGPAHCQLGARRPLNAKPEPPAGAATNEGYE